MSSSVVDARRPDGGPTSDWTLHRVRRSVDPRLHFAIALPPGMGCRAAAADPPDVGEQVALARFDDGVRDGRRAGVLALRLARDVDPAAWLELACEARGEQVLRRRVSPTPGGDIPDFVVAGSGRDAGRALRRVAVKEGDRLLVLDLRGAPGEPGESEDLERAARSFALLTPRGGACAEPLAIRSRRAPLDLAFVFPQSWRWREPAGGRPDTWVAELTTSAGRDAGVISVVASLRAASEEGPERVLDGALGALRRAGLTFETPTLAPHAVVPEGAEERLGARAPASLAGVRRALQIGVLRAPGAWVVATLVAPPADAAADRYLVASRAIDVLLGGATLGGT